VLEVRRTVAVRHEQELRVVVAGLRFGLHAIDEQGRPEARGQAGQLGPGAGAVSAGDAQGRFGPHHQIGAAARQRRRRHADQRVKRVEGIGGVRLGIAAERYVGLHDGDRERRPGFEPAKLAQAEVAIHRNEHRKCHDHKRRPHTGAHNQIRQCPIEEIEQEQKQRLSAEVEHLNEGREGVQGVGRADGERRGEHADD